MNTETFQGRTPEKYTENAKGCFYPALVLIIIVMGMFIIKVLETFLNRI